MSKSRVQSVEIFGVNCVFEHYLCTQNRTQLLVQCAKTIHTHRFLPPFFRALPTAILEQITPVFHQVFRIFHHTYNYDNYIILLFLSRGART